MKKLLIIATGFVIFGLLIFLLLSLFIGFDFTRLGTANYETNVHEPKEPFSDLNLEIETADVTILPSEDGVTRIICTEESLAKHSVSVADNTLTVKLVNEKKWSDYIFPNFGKTEITVYLADVDCGALNVKASTADVTVSQELSFTCAKINLSTGDVSFSAAVKEELSITTSTGDITVGSSGIGSLKASVSTGKINISNLNTEGGIDLETSTGDILLSSVRAGSLNAEGDTSDVHLTDVVISAKITVETSTGDVRLDAADAAELSITTDTGHVKGTLLTEKIFFTTTDTGKVDAPRCTAGGVCEITTDTGDIIISLAE